MNEIKYEMLKNLQYDIDKAKACYDFITGDDEPTKEAQQTNEPDGIYFVGKDGKVISRFAPDAASKDKVYGIGVKYGGHTLVVALKDADGDTPLTRDEDSKGVYYPNIHDAVNDWDGKANTDKLKDALHKNIKLEPGQFIPSIGQLLFMFVNFNAINEAIKAVDGDPLEDLWYWSSTEHCVTHAWYMGLYDGHVGSYTKATYQLRVRPVSEFLY